MWRWLYSNKEWLFSGAGIVVLVFLVQSVFRYWKRRKLPSPPVQEQSSTVTTKVPPIKTPEIGKTDVVCSLSAETIVRKIDEVPLLQRSDVIKSYIGLRVAWEGKLISARNISDDLAQLYVRLPGKRREYEAFLNVVPSRYPGLRLLEKGYPVRISGRIAQIRGWFDLEDAEIEYDLGSLNR